jgi:methylamine dehydrogenase heavy chain
MARMRDRSRFAAALVTAAWLATASSVSAQQVPPTMPERAQLSGQEDHPTLVLPPPNPHWVLVQDLNFPFLVATKSYLLNGDDLKVLGMFNTGYVPNPVIAQDNSAIYVAETYWSRGSRGDRTDVLTFFDPSKLEATGEVQLQRGRFLVVTKKYNAGLTTDGRYLLSFNMDPSTSVSVVDVRERKYVGELETPGCAHVFPMGPTRFAMLCADGSFATINFGASAQAQVTDGQSFFDSDQDPVLEHPALHRASGKAFFISYEGWVYPVTFTGDTPAIGERFKLEGAEGWRPGGWQLATYHAATNRLFVLMHEGDRWTHKQAGHEIWVYDVAGKKLLQRMVLPHHSISIAVTQDDQPLLFALSETADLTTFDATSYQQKADRSALGISPFNLSVFGE